MALGRKVHHVVKLVLGKQFIGQHTVADVAFHKEAAFVINVVGNGSQVAGIGQGIQNHHLDIAMLGQDILDVIGTDKSGRTGYKISLHIVIVLIFLMDCSAYYQRRGRDGKSPRP